jgi:hypothetical protein
VKNSSDAFQQLRVQREFRLGQLTNTRSERNRLIATFINCGLGFIRIESAGTNHDGFQAAQPHSE